MIFLIGGTSRSGKSTVARQLAASLGFSYFPLDSLVSVMESLYPGCGLKHEDVNRDLSPKIAELLKSLLGHLEYEDLDLVIDTYQLFPSDYIKQFPDRRYRILFMGYPDLRAEEKLVFLRQHEREKDWTRDTSDKEMLRILNLFINESRLVRQQCQELDLPFIDTGAKFDSSIRAAVDFFTRNSQ